MLIQYPSLPIQRRDRMIEVCPSGKEVEIRKMKLSDEDIMTDSTLGKDKTVIDAFLEAITGLPQEDLEEMIIGDRTYLVIRARAFSKGEYFYPKVTCPGCSKRFEASINLEKLKITELDEKLVGSDRRFQITLPVCGEVLNARLLTGKEEKQMREIKKDHPEMLMSYLMMIRTESIEGMKFKNIKWFRDLDVEDVDYFKDEYERHDCGVDTSVEMECPHCPAVFDMEVPFDANFFLQSGRKKK